MNNYILSICIPTYNGGEHLYNSVLNILKCSDNRFEIVVTDNCSNDDSITKLNRIEDRRLRICVNEKNEGAMFNWYLALSNGHGKYIMLLQDNDEIVIENLVAFVDLCEHLSAPIVKNGTVFLYPNQGFITATEFIYYSAILSHVSYSMYLSEEFRKIDYVDSINIEKTCYPMTFWDIEIFANCSLNDRIYYINSNIKIVRIPERLCASRTRSVMDKGVLINYTYEWYIYYVREELNYINSKISRRKEFVLFSIFLFRAFIMMTTFRYYDNMHDRVESERYGVPYIEFKKKGWLLINDNFYHKYLSFVNQYYTFTKEEREILRLIAKVNKEQFKNNYYIAKHLWNPRNLYSRAYIYLLKHKIEADIEKIK